MNENKREFDIASYVQSSREEAIAMKRNTIWL